MIDRRSRTPSRSAQAESSRAIRSGARGSRSAAVPTPTSEAPAKRYWAASLPVLMPPRPITGTPGSAWRTRQVASNPKGSNAGPLTPPVPKPILGVRRDASITRPGMVFTNVRPVAPCSTATRAASTTPAPRVGESFTKMGRAVWAREARTNAASATGSAPNSIPPAFTLGQLTLSSNASTPGTLSRPPTTISKSSTLFPTTLTITRVSG